MFISRRRRACLFAVIEFCSVLAVASARSMETAWTRAPRCETPATPEWLWACVWSKAMEPLNLATSWQRSRPLFRTFSEHLHSPFCGGKHKRNNIPISIFIHEVPFLLSCAKYSMLLMYDVVIVISTLIYSILQLEAFISQKTFNLPRPNQSSMSLSFSAK